MSEIVKYLHQLEKLYGKPQNKYHKWILKHGKSFKGSERDTKKESLLIEHNHPHGIKKCYYNSQVLLTISDKFQYYEGWYITENLPIPLEHAFIVYNGKVIDLTSNGRFQVIEYFGVPIPTKYVLLQILKDSKSDAFLFRYWREKQIKGDRKMKGYKGKNIFDTLKEKLGKITEADMTIKDRVWIDWEDGTTSPIDISQLGNRYKIKG